MSLNNAQASKPGFMSRTADKMSSSIKGMEVPKLMKLMKALNVANAALLITTGFVRFFTLDTLEPGNGGEKVSLSVLAFYTIMFGILLGGFELGWGEKFQDKLKRNFGFVFSYWGRSLFLLFAATLCFGCPVFGSSKPKAAWVSLVAGILTALNALFNCYVICSHPGFSGGKPKIDETAPAKAKQTSEASKAADPWAKPVETTPPADFVGGNDFYGSSSNEPNPFSSVDGGNGIGDDNPFANI